MKIVQKEVNMSSFDPNFKAVVRNVQNNDLYVYLGEDKYRNIRTQKEGHVPPGTAEKILKINAEATFFINNCSTFEELITRLNLKIEK